MDDKTYRGLSWNYIDERKQSILAYGVLVIKKTFNLMLFSYWAQLQDSNNLINSHEGCIKAISNSGPSPAQLHLKEFSFKATKELEIWPWNAPDNMMMMFAYLKWNFFLLSFGKNVDF